MFSIILRLFGGYSPNQSTMVERTACINQLWFINPVLIDRQTDR